MPPRRPRRNEPPPGPGELVIRVQATEETLARLWWLMLYAEAPFKKVVTEEGPLPFDEPIPVPAAKELEIDYEAVKREIVKRLVAYVEKHGKEEAAAVIERHGGKTLRQVPEDQLMGLFDALA